MLLRSLYCALFALLTLAACQKEAITPQPIDQQQTNIGGSNGGNSSNNSGIIYSDRGAYAPFGQNSCWVYLDSTIVHDCIVDSNGNVRSDTIIRYDTLVHTDTVIIDSMEYFQVGAQLIRIQNNRYYQRINGVDAQYMVENPTVGMTWTNAIPTSFPHMPQLVYDYRVVATGQTVQTPAGTFNNVVHISQSANGVPEDHYYQSGVGLIYKTGPRFNTSWQYYLKQYNIL